MTRKRISLRSHTGPDGSLDIRVRTDAPDADVDVEIVVRSNAPEPESPGWPEGFFERTFGSLAGAGLERHGEGNYEARDAIP